MAARKIRGRREPRDITVESYANITEGPVPLLSSSQGSSKSFSSSRPNSEEKSLPSNPLSTASSIEGTHSSSSSSSQTDQINFISGNPFVEVTKGILHLYKEE